MMNEETYTRRSQLQAWAGDVVFKRGQSYEQRGSVHELAVSDDGALVAWVEGSRRYATRVNLDAEQLTSDCTCPYGSVCKHAVAVALDYLNRLEQTPLPTATATDPRIILLKRDAVGSSDWIGTITAQNQTLQTYLATYSQTELVELVMEFTWRFPEVRDAIVVRQMLADDNTDRLEAEVLARIIRTSAEPAWNEWEGDGHVPDYDPIRDSLRLLLDRGHADAVVRLGKQLLQDGIEQVEQSYDDGDTAIAIAACLSIVFEALPSSSLEPDEQIMWSIDALLRDPADICSDARGVLDKPYGTATWSIVADELIQKLDSLPAATNDFMREYEREQVTNFAILALEKAERGDEIIMLCVRETRGSQGYERLVERLLDTERHAEAEQWARKGIEASAHQAPGIADALIDLICTLRGEADDWAMIAALRAEQFFQRPSILSLRTLEEAAAQADQAPAVRAAAMYYLECGQMPQRTPRPLDGTTIPAWSLPDTGIAPATWRYPKQFPQLALLIALAIEEQQPTEVIGWYDRRDEAPNVQIDDDAVATAIVRTHPGRATAIWQGLAEAHIARTNSAAYMEAAQILHKLRTTWTEQGKAGQWRSFVEGLRTSNKRKRRLVEILDALLRAKP